MNAVKYLFAFWAGILVYASLSLAFGGTGFSAYSQLENEQQKQEANIENLALINRDLEDTMNSLLYDKDTLALYAREQGYGSPEERFIRIVGLGASQKAKSSAGEILAAAEPQYTSDRTLRIIGFCAGLSVLVCMVFFDVLRFLRDRV